MSTTFKTLEHFNGVLLKKASKNSKPLVTEQGYIIEPNALWAKDAIMAFYDQNLDGEALNKTFHKSWKKIKESTREDLLVEQIKHYLSTYGSGFNSEVYIPNEVLNVPDVKLVYKVVKGYTKEELTEKALTMLRSGMALKEDTIDDLLMILVDLADYTFTGREGIKNKEAIVKIADTYGVVPHDTTDFLRYIIYRSTDSTLLIKNKETIKAIKDSSFNPALQFNAHGLEKLAEVFNRYKPLFLAFKGRCPAAINKIAKLSKKCHKPMAQNALNKVTSVVLTEKDMHWLDNATPYALFKALQTCYVRAQGQNAFVYRIRNGKSWVTEGESNVKACKENLGIIKEYLKGRFSLEGVKVFLPKDIKYALPTSEKMYIGNIPTGTRFYGKKLAVGIYWENQWGARDFDLSGLPIGGKIGWNASYVQGDGNLMYSGDITNAPDGAVEYLYASKGLDRNVLVMNNVYSGDATAGLKIILGRGDKISRDYMMNPENLFAEVKTNSVEKQSVLGLFLPKKDKQCFVLLNFGAGQAKVSGNSILTDNARKALVQQWSKPFSLNKLMKLLGAELVESPELADHNFEMDALEKDSFVKLFGK